MAQDPIADVLRTLPLTDAQRADAWDAYMGAADPVALTSALTPLNLPQETKATLWDLKSGRTPLPQEPGLLGRIWEGLKTPAAMAMEVAGRPGELVSGTVGGTLQTGSLAEGLKRGWAAFAEPNLRDSQIRESMSKVIEEQAPEFAKAHPFLTAGAGFGLDVATDPTNLLAGAGLWGKGVRALGRGATEIAAASKLGEVLPALRMEALVSEGRTAAGKFLGLTPGDMKRTAEAQGRAGQVLLPIVDEILKKTTPEQQQLLSLAAHYPKSAEAAQVAANPVLQDLLERSTQAFADIHAKEVAGGVRTATRALNVTESTAERLAALSAEERTAAERILRQGPEVPLTAADEALLAENANLRKAIEGTQKQLYATSKTGEVSYFADPATVRLQPDGAVEVSTAAKNYVPNMQEIGAPTGPYITGGRRSYAMKSALDKAVPFREALADPKLKTVGNIAELLQRRHMESVRALTETQLVRDYLGEFGSTVAKPGYTQFSEAFIKQSKMPQELADAVAGQYLPSAIVQDLEKYQLRLADPTAMDSIYRQGTRLWKTMATTLRLPAHQANNFLGNIANMYAAGNMPASQVVSKYWQASQALRNEAKASPAMTQMIEEARKLGVIGEQAGSAGIEFAGSTMRGGPKTGLSALMEGAYNPLNPDNPVYTKIRQINQQQIEDPAKLALFMHERQLGKSAEQASVTVRKVLFDYNELSPAERQVRDFVPFYTWTRKNIPLQLATFVENPSKISHQQQFLNLFREWSRLSGQEPLTRADVRSYAEPSEMIPVPALQGQAGSPVALTTRLPFFDINLLAPGSISEEVGQRVSPLITTPASLLLGRNVLTGQSLDRAKTPNLPGRLLPEALGGAAPIGPRGELRQTGRQQLVTGMLPVPMDPLLRAVAQNPETENLPSTWDAFVRSLGLTPTVLSPQLKRQAREDQLRALREERTAQRQRIR